MPERPKILIVDDRSENLFALNQLLETLGVDVFQALRGAEALNMILEQDFCVAIVDIQMPEMDGYELVELLRSNKMTAALPVIFVSAIYSDEYHHRKGYEAGAVDFLSKPFVPEILLSKVKVFIDLYHQRQALQEEIKQRRRAEAALEERNKDLQELGYQLHEQNVSLLKMTDELEEKNTHLETMAAELQGRNEALTKVMDELHQANQALSRLNADKNKFFSIISHDLRGPFNPLMGNAQLLAEPPGPLTQQDVQDMAQTIYRQAKVVYNLLDNLLTWARLQQEDGMQWQSEPIELKALTQDTLAALESTATQKEIELHNSVAADVWVQADRHMLETVIRNLTSNALKFTLRGGQVTLTAQSSQGDSHLVTVAVQDTGVGITPTNIERLFRIDTQHTTQGTEKEKGTGLGLIVCKEMVERNGGQIRVESDGVPGKGTKVEFTVPLTTPLPA